jgi:SRSO17 transposase
MALTMLDRAKANGFSGVVLADALYGSVTAFRGSVEEQGWTYCVGVESTLSIIDAAEDLGKVPSWSGKGRPPTRPSRVAAKVAGMSVKRWAMDHAADFRTVNWREGSKVRKGKAGKLYGRFAAWRVRPAHRLSDGRKPQGECWLLAEWPEGEDAPTKYFFSNLPATASLRQLVRTAKGRWWVEQSYREMKEELGLDHFEGRFWVGWHHHMVLVMLAYAFIVAYRRQKRGDMTSPR